ncbi:MAG: DUF4040 domain-containing protein [Oscillospiraceae bacterium]|nr:DUF4040 domain-containing protein [Oscillospiraceae bacterium]
MTAVECILLLLLLVTGVTAPLQKHPLIMVITFTLFGLVLSVLWMLLQAPDLAITEAAVGTGVTGVLFYLTLRRIRRMQGTEDDE